jgi:hypothetical protein
MPERVMSKQELLSAFADAYERVIAAATRAERQGAGSDEAGWGPREALAHLAGWETMATVRIPAVVAGMAPLEFKDEAQNRVMNDAINAAFVAVAGQQPIAALGETLRHAYQRTLAVLGPLADRYFQPGEYVYERTRGVIEHCGEHIDEHIDKHMSLVDGRP